MQIDRQTVLYAAELSRLKIEDEEADDAADAMKKMMEMIDALNSSEDDESDHETIKTDNSAMREDTVKPSFPRKEILENAPEHDEEYFIVPDTF